MRGVGVRRPAVPPPCLNDNKKAVSFFETAFLSIQLSRRIGQPGEVVERDVVKAREGDKMVHGKFLMAVFVFAVLLLSGLQQNGDVLLF
mgnify:CR=1 FL=1